MRRAALLLAGLLVAAAAAGQPSVGGIAAKAFPVQLTIAQLEAITPDGTQGVRIVTDDADCSSASADDGVVLCIDTGSWELVQGSGGGSGDVTAVGDCATGDCFQSAAAGTIFAAPSGGGVATFRALTDADVPNSITVDLATAATTANAGDSATAFFAAGTIEHERGGLEADVSAFAGLVRIASGSTTAVTSLAGFNTALGSSVADGAHTTDTDTTCLDAGVDCLFAASLSEGGAATTATALVANGTNCSAGEWAAGVDASGAAEGCTADDAGTDDQIASEVPFTPAGGIAATDVQAALEEVDAEHTVDTDDQDATEVAYTPTTGTDWTDPDPADAGGALDDLAGRLTIEEAAAPLAHAASHGVAGGDAVTITEAQVSDLAHTVDTGPQPDCSGTTTYQDGDGGCDDISTVYAAAAHASTHSDGGADEVAAEDLATACSDGEILEASSGGWVCAADDTGAASMPAREFIWPAAALMPFDYGADGFAPISLYTGATVPVLTRAYDDDTDECAGFSFQVPGDIDTSGTVTFAAYWYAATAAADDVVWDVRHLPVDGGESWDQALTTVTAAASTADGDQDEVTETTWTETVSNLGWAADDFAHGAVCRDGDNGADDLAGDALLLTLKVEVPRA